MNPAAQTRMAPRRIIVVDDLPDNFTLLRVGLEMHGFEVSTPQTSQELINCLLNPPWDAMLLDVNLPGELGTTLADRVRADNPTIPIAYLTAYTNSGTLRAIAARQGIPVLDRVDMADIDKLVGFLNDFAPARAA